MLLNRYHKSTSDTLMTVFCYVLLAFVSVVIMLKQLVVPGYYNVMADNTYSYISWAWQFNEALYEGVIYPRWLPNNFWGYGSPTFILYPPLGFYLAAFYNIITNSIVTAINLVQLTGLILTSFGIFALLRQFYSIKICLFSAILGIINPFNVIQLYLLGGFCSNISALWFAPIIIFTWRYLETRNIINLILAGICYGGLILTHLINAYMFSFVIVSLITYLSITKKIPRCLIAIPVITIIGFLISSSYLLPLIFEKNFVNLQSFIVSGTGFHYPNHFILPNLTNTLSPDHVWRAYYNTYVQMTISVFVTILLCIISILKLSSIAGFAEVNSLNRYFFATASITFLFLFGFSEFVWVSIPFMEYIQFPIRWLNITCFFVILMFASVLCMIDNTIKNKIIVHLIYAMLLVTSGIASYFYINVAPSFLEKELTPVKIINSSMEHLPKGVKLSQINKDGAVRDKVVLVNGYGKAEIITWQTATRLLNVVAEGPLTLKIRTFNFPGWNAYLDGTRTEIFTEAGTRAIMTKIPTGNHHLELQFRDTPARLWGKLLTLISFTGLLLFLVISQLLKLRKNKLRRNEETRGAGWNRNG